MDWIGLDWIGLEWIGLDWNGLAVDNRDTRRRRQMADESTYEPITSGRTENRLQTSAGPASGDRLRTNPAGQSGAAGQEASDRGSDEAEGGRTGAVSDDDGLPAIGPAGAAPQWRDFYRAIRDAVSDMRSGK
ncbi:hypothetical protein GZH47_23760 [Paenibacillus rhizovicinus]|uniref:Uncharacterized protein n=1 Tax=Paenibacillus rhizovicinus TaxID=2704463 RepID=A0A6C0P4Z2_9BACL|nr:hypothetical protein [Paenibacillus rhizovicinus]QHW33515.1 hypothetical protein GZH47_23760 [Paenibacillus rhizovicinus]